MIVFFANGQSLKFFTPVIAADSLNYLTAKVHFDEEWDGYSKWLHFRQGENLDATVYDIALDVNDEVTSDDALNLGIGEWEIYVTGTKDSSRLTTQPVILTVKESGLIDAPLHGLPMSVAEQVDVKASTALLMAQAVKDAADSGEFDGKSFEIKGFYNSAEELEAAQENPSPGDLYGVGTGEPYDLYVWDGVGSVWVNNGKLQGAKGDDGARGVTFTPSVASNGNLSWTNDGGLENPTTVNIMGAKGDKGDKGEDGKSPYQAACEAGYTGTEQTFNSALTSFPYHNARHLPDGADPITVKTGNIADAAVTGSKIADGAVSQKFTATIPAEGWTGDAVPYTNVVTVPGLLGEDDPDVDVIPSDTYETAEAETDAYAAIYRMKTTDNTLTVYAKEKPTVNISIQLKAVRK